MKQEEMQEAILLNKLVLDRLLTTQQKKAYDEIRQDIEKDRERGFAPKEFFQLPKISIQKCQCGSSLCDLFQIRGVGYSSGHGGFPIAVAVELCEFFNHQPRYQHRLKNMGQEQNEQ